MRIVRLVATVGFGLLGAPLLAPDAAFAAPSTPMGASAARAGDNPYQIRVGWKPVAGADHYLVEVDDGVTDTVNVVPATVNAITVDAPDPCAKYLISVGARDGAEVGGTTGWMTVRSLAPGVPGGLSATRTLDDRNVATANWRAPLWAGYGPLGGYRTQLVRASDNVVVLDRTTTDVQASFTDVDRAEKYTLNVTSFNQFGTCLVAKATIGADKPDVPLEVTAARDNPTDPASVAAAWKPPADLSAPPTYYMINYWTPGKLTKTLRVDAPATTGRLSLDPSRSWTVRVQSFNDVAGSATLSNTVTLDAIAVANPDTIPPTLTPTLSPTANRAGWNNTPVTVSFACADTQSGVESCTDPIQVSAEGAGRTVAGTAVDYAGNTTTKTATVNIDKTPPTITAALSPEPSTEGWNNGPVTVSFACTDALSGLAICPAPVKVPGDVATRTIITGTATDKAGNTATTTVTVDVDQTAPTVTANGATDGARYPLSALPTVTCRTTDAGSGVSIQATPTTSRTERGAYTTTCADATDNAGNTAPPVSVSYTVYPTIASLTTLTNRYIATNHARNAAGLTHDLDNKLATGKYCDYLTKVAREPGTRNPNLTSAQAAELTYWGNILAAGSC